MIPRDKGPKTRPPFCKFAPWLIILLLAALSRLNFQIAQAIKQKTKGKVKIRPRTTNQKSSFRPVYQYRGNNPNALCESISHVSLLSSLWQRTCDYSSGANLSMRSFFLPWNSCSDPCRCNTFSYMPSALSAWCLSHTETRCIRVIVPRVLTFQISRIISCFDGVHSQGEDRTVRGQLPMSIPTLNIRSEVLALVQ